MLTLTEQAAAEASASGPAAVTVGPRTFVVPPPSVEDYAALIREMRRQIMSGAGDPLDLANDRIAKAEKAGRAYSPTVVKAIISEAMATAASKEAKAEPTNDQIHAQAQSYDGLTWWAWFLVNRADPSVSLAQVREWLPDDRSAFKITSDLARVMEHKEISPK